MGVALISRSGSTLWRSYHCTARPRNRSARARDRSKVREAITTSASRRFSPKTMAREMPPAPSTKAVLPTRLRPCSLSGSSWSKLSVKAR